MSDRIDELDVFIAVVESGSLRAAAARLRRSPASVTRALAQLEDRLSRRLVDRTTRRLAVTEAGRAAYEAAIGMTAAWRALAAAPPAAPLRGLVRLTAPVLFGRRYVAPALDAFLLEWPAVTAELLLDDRHLDFIEHGLDVAIRLGALPDSSLRAQRVGGVRWIVVASPAYLAERGVPQKPQDLGGHAIIAESPRAGRPAWSFPAGGRSETLAVEPRLLSNDIEVQIEAARNGRGMARVLSYQAADDLRSGALVRVLQRFEGDDIPVHLVTVGGRYRSNKTRAIANHLADHLRRVLAAQPDRTVKKL
ncbi:LysR family transcriptional regulator [Nitratireductor sp. ZSWI3]|uniref:LysR family transcriptional regulator n=1 Tax=Nitratireductor sp. ZSWI3 TaxID=2966359 RepID=UPI00214F6E66|nr:LysR family transcriptional regulator [Nitratireductor sp. ZSWI3]MCR4268515.1 LysR family transcriptional regulator [Nitratireductor sp. ZSWI3]